MEKCDEHECAMYEICAKAPEVDFDFEKFRQVAEKLIPKLSCEDLASHEKNYHRNTISKVAILIAMEQERAGYQACYLRPDMDMPFSKKAGFTLCNQTVCCLFSACLFGNYGKKNSEDFSWISFVNQNVIDELRSAKMEGTIAFRELTIFPEQTSNETIENAVRHAQWKKGYETCFRLGEREEMPRIVPSSEKNSG